MLVTPALVGMMIGAALAAPAHAQQNEVTIEASVIRGAVGYARRVSPTTLVGVEAGFGFPQIDRTLTPTNDDPEGEPDFEEYLHAAVFVRVKPTHRFEVDAGLRGSVADLWACTASDCWPAVFGGAYVQPMIGGSRIKVGARLTAGWIADSEERGPDSSTFVVGLNPFILRLTLPW
jgi:hypothetical protein